MSGSEILHYLQTNKLVGYEFMVAGRGHEAPGQSKDSITHCLPEHYFMWVCFCPPSHMVESQLPQIGACTRRHLWYQKEMLSSGKLAFTASGSKLWLQQGRGARPHPLEWLSANTPSEMA